MSIVGIPFGQLCEENREFIGPSGDWLILHIWTQDQEQIQWSKDHLGASLKRLSLDVSGASS